MSEKKSRREKATAYHEAGHAVVALAVKRPLISMTIEITRDSLGHVQYANWGEGFDPASQMDSRVERRLENAILTTLAGGVAEKLFTGRWNNEGARDDLHKAIDYASYFMANDVTLRAYVRYMRLRVTDLLNTPLHRAEVQAIAEALLAQKRLSASQARQIALEAKRHAIENLRGGKP